MNDKVIFSMVRVGRVYPPSKQVLRDITLGFFHGAKIGVIGLNGSGKSTLLKIMAGIDKEYLGDVLLSNGYTVGYLAQEPVLDNSKNVKQIVEEGVQEVVDLLARYEEINNGFAEPDADYDALLEEQAKVQEKLDHLNAWDLESRLDLAMEALRCPPPDAPIKVLSGGERRRVALCRLLLQEPDILLLDEPTNHLDAESVAWLERYLQEYGGTVVAITHDRYFLDNVAGWILELDRGHGIPWKGNYSSWLEQKQARLAQEEKSDTRHQQTLARELDWIRMTPKGKQTKSKARISAYEQLLSKESERRREELQIYIPPGPRLGDIVIELKGVTKSYGEKLLIEDLTMLVPPGSIIGVVGGNGAGKTTLFNMIAGTEEPDAGTIKIGKTVQLAYVEQMRDSLVGSNSVWEEISGKADTLVLGTREVNSRAYVASFNFPGGDQQKQVEALSGGERNRVLLAKMLKEGGNLLLLDEPTNDLDVNTLRALEEALESFAGCALVISHDRWFLDRVATHIMAFEGESQVRWYEGNYSEYDEDRRKRLGHEADRPQRVKYKNLTRN
jgi:ATP-binding cassette ChvD family protein